MDKQIKTYDVQSIELHTSFNKALKFIANPRNLPLWTSAFKEADEELALLVTPNGELQIGLTTVVNGSGTIDWHMKMSDGSIGKAFSRLTELPNGNVVYSFVLLAPSVTIEKVEGNLEAQRKILAGELKNLERILGEK
jgi:hypothetical protein